MAQPVRHVLGLPASRHVCSECSKGDQYSRLKEGAIIPHLEISFLGLPANAQMIGWLASCETNAASVMARRSGLPCIANLLDVALLAGLRARNGRKRRQRDGADLRQGHRNG
jgi:hypothetical protein